MLYLFGSPLALRRQPSLILCRGDYNAPGTLFDVPAIVEDARNGRDADRGTHARKFGEAGVRWSLNQTPGMDELQQPLGRRRSLSLFDRTTTLGVISAVEGGHCRLRRLLAIGVRPTCSAWAM